MLMKDHPSSSQPVGFGVSHSLYVVYARAHASYLYGHVYQTFHRVIYSFYSLQTASYL